MDNKNYDVIVIGGGIGGLICANFLVNKGLKTLVLEKESYLGGYCSTIAHGPYKWNVAVHAIRGLGEKEPFGKLLQRLNVYDSLDIRYPEIGFAGVFDKERFYLPKDSNLFKDQLINKFHDQSENLNKFFETVRDFNILTQYKDVKDQTFQEYLDQFFKDKTLILYLTSFLLPMGRPPEETSAIFSILYYKAILFGGVSIIRGGVQKLIEVLAHRFKEKGGEIFQKYRVSEIMLNQNGDMAEGVKAINDKGEEVNFEARYFVSNIAPRSTFRDLIPRPSIAVQDYAANLLKLKLSSSAFIIFLGLKRELSLPKELEFPQKPLQLGIILRENPFEEDLCEIKKIYFVFSSAYDESLCQKGQECISIITNVPFKDEAFWKENKERFAEKLLQIASGYFKELKENIDCRVVFSPYDLYKRTGNTEGAIIGWDVSPNQVLKKRLNQDTPLKNLFLAGHWTQPGPDISLVSISGYQASNLTSSAFNVS